jgi:hypothetical protein
MGNVSGLVEQYKMLTDNLQDGIVFYTNLQDAIHAVLCECRDFAMSRSLQQVSRACARVERTSGEQVANCTFGFGVGRQRMAVERGATPRIPRRTCSPRYGLQSCRGKSAGVAKRPREPYHPPQTAPLSPLLIHSSVCLTPPDGHARRDGGGRAAARGGGPGPGVW